jgi:hypothetical protein
MHLSPIEARVLGALMEKEATTPEYYPLSLNALVNACNQKNNREPLMQINEEETRLALHRLEDQKLAGPNRGHDSRVTKYEHRSQEVFNFTRAEAALICVLLLRGPQTPGELRGRTERIYRFEELDDVLAALQKLIDRDPVSPAPKKSATPTCSLVRSSTLRFRSPELSQNLPIPPSQIVSSIWNPKSRSFARN